MKTVLLVCTGNTCRSSMAEAILRKLVEESGLSDQIRVRSAGVSALPGQPANPAACSAVEELWRLDLSNHSATQLTPALVAEADLILTMSSSHKEFIESICPDARHKVFQLAEFAGSPGREVYDPIGSGIAEYRRVAREIFGYLQASLAKITHFLRIGGALMKIAIGSDHGGFRLKELIKRELASSGFQVADFGTDSTESCDYPDPAFKVAEAVARGEFDRGILICGTGIGMSIAANKVPGVRAALCHDVFSAEATRQHNDSNVLTMGERVIGPGLALKIVQTWLGTDFSGDERHLRRIAKIDQYSAKGGK